MVRDIIIIDQNGDINEEMRIFKIKKSIPLGVTRNGKPSGVVTKFDTNKNIIQILLI